MIDFLSTKSPETKLLEIWNEIKENDHIHFVEDNPNGVAQVQICGRILQETFTVQYCLRILNSFYDTYGKRAEQAASNEGIDWKAVSHAIRAAYQAKEILTENNITFPLKQAELIKTIKAGKMDYITEVSPLLDDLMEEVEILAEQSTLPEKVNTKEWDKFIIWVCDNYICK